MTHGGMAEARPDTPKKYTCACGLSQEDRKSKFSGKCRHCHTRAKYLRGQSSFDSGSASRGWGSTGSSPNNSSNNSDGDGGNSSSSNSSRSSSSSAGSGGGGAAGLGGRGGLVRQVSIAETRRRSRSMDRYDCHRITDPPPYSWVWTSAQDGAREGGRTRGTSAPVRRAESEGSAAGTRAAQMVTPPPPYEVAQNQVRQSYYPLPPSYEEALANSMSGVTVSGSLRESQPSPTPTPTHNLTTSGITSPEYPVAMLPEAALSSRTSRVLEEQAAVLEAQREAQIEAQRRAQREAEREAQLERERDMERQRLRELQLAQYCGCAKCQGLYYSYYYNDDMNDGGAFPMETQVLMQEVLTDGLAFCSLM